MTQTEPRLPAAQRAFLDHFVPANRDRIRLIATDVDGTLTDPTGVIRPVLLEALAHLRELTHPPTLILVTGRPAAAVQALLLYTGFGHGPVVAENGAVVVPHVGAAPYVRHPFRDRYLDPLLATLERAGVRARLTADNAARFSDVTFLPADTTPTPDALAHLALAIEAALEAAPATAGLPPTRVLYSTVHVHVGAAAADKGEALGALLGGDPPAVPDAPIPPDACLFLGDSGNDAAMFTTFPDRAVAVPGTGPALHPGLADLARYAAPAVADEGFAAVVRALFPAADTSTTAC